MKKHKNKTILVRTSCFLYIYSGAKTKNNNLITKQ